MGLNPLSLYDIPGIIHYITLKNGGLMTTQSKVTSQRHPASFSTKLQLKLDLDWFIHLRGKIASVWF